METQNKDAFDGSNVGSEHAARPMSLQTDLAAEEHPDEGHPSKQVTSIEPVQSACRDRCPDLTYCDDPDSRAKVTPLNFGH